MVDHSVCSLTWNHRCLSLVPERLLLNWNYFSQKVALLLFQAHWFEVKPLHQEDGSIHSWNYAAISLLIVHPFSLGMAVKNAYSEIKLELTPEVCHFVTWCKWLVDLSLNFFCYRDNASAFFYIRQDNTIDSLLNATQATGKIFLHLQINFKSSRSAHFHDQIIAFPSFKH